MKKSLSISEQKLVLMKLRAEYSEYAKKFTVKVFDLEAFEKRLEVAFNNRFDMNRFFFTEISTLEQLKEKMDEKLRDKENPFLAKVDKILEDNVKKIASYPDYDFHSSASYELKKILGALKEFNEKEYLWVEIIFKLENDSFFLKLMHYFHKNLHYLIGETGRSYAPRIEDHVLLLDRPFKDTKKVEIDEKRFIKEIALFLNELKTNLVDILHENKLSYPHKVLPEEKLIHIDDSIKYMTKEKIIKSVINKINIILSDFRIHEFKGPKRTTNRS
ncbi:MAG TPA: hypothetical protein ENI73_07915 [Spirochaetes bacterium]|nr:hypothetical protein [Spirochaetota bacterium]